MRLPVNRTLPLAALVLLAACGGSGAVLDAVPAAPTGPAGDYPMVVGPAYSVGNISYTPADTLNYDAVGLAVIGGEGGAAITAAHHTLPLPSYVEVTALGSGRTIMARVERRGPMIGNQLVQLSPGAAAQLGLAAQSTAEVRVRRINLPEAERALLRAGQQAPARMDTPKALLDVLRRRLSLQNGELTRTAAPPPPAVLAEVPVAPPPKPVIPAPAAIARALPQGSLVVQIGAFADKARAQALAGKTGGQLAPGSGLWRVRMGPFRSRNEADAALAKARNAGYSGARIQTVR